MCLRGMARVELPPNHCMRYNSVKGSAVPQNHIEAPALVWKSTPVYGIGVIVSRVPRAYERTH